MLKALRNVPLIVVAGTLLAGCGGAGDKVHAQSTDDGVRTGPGVTADTITLGALTDLSGPAKSFGVTSTAGQRIWADEVNAAGGICGRRIELRIQDHGYKADSAAIVFPELEPQVVGFVEILGSPVLAALRPDLEQKEITSVGISYSSDLLDAPYLIIAGTTYDLDMINALNWMLKSGQIAKGDKIGHVYMDGEYGGNGLRGSRFFAQRHGLEVVAAKVTPADTDMKSVITKFKGAGVDAIAVSALPSQTASVALNNAALRVNAPMIGSIGAFAPQMLASPPVAKALRAMHITGSIAPFASSARTQSIATAFEDANPEVDPAIAVNAGYANGLIWGQLLRRACEAKDLSRAGIHAAMQASDEVEVGGLLPELDFTKLGSPSSRASYVAKIDPAIPGGLKQVTDLFTSADAKAYRAPKES